jgi:peptidoglycan/xylan/chitin deacetylase (PgdA/CDA1 family)
MAASGLISFGAHTVNHLAVSSLSDAELDFEIDAARRELAQHLGAPSGFFAFPYGRHADLDPRSAEVLRRNGFAGAVTLVAGDATSAPSAYALPRIFVECGDDVPRLRAKIAGADAPFWLGRRILDRRTRRREAAAAR